MQVYLITEKISNIIYFFANMVSIVNFYIRRLASKKFQILKNNNELKKNQLDTCIICGNGPSLKDFNFECVKGMPTFATNYFFKGSTLVEHEPTYLVAVDDVFSILGLEDKGFDYIKKSYTNHASTKFILRFDILKKMKEIDPQLSHSHFVYYKRIQYAKKVNCNMSGIMTACHNVVLMALQCAISMGYKKIFLIGCENNFFANYSHFYSDSEPKHRPDDWSGLKYVVMVFNHYDAIRLYCDKNGIEVYNITPKSYISSFEEMPLEEFYKLYGTQKA